LSNPSTQFRVPYLNGIFVRCWDGPSTYALDLNTPQPRTFGSFKSDVNTTTSNAQSGSIALMAIIKY
jgi:hypothetical protein